MPREPMTARGIIRKATALPTLAEQIRYLRLRLKTHRELILNSSEYIAWASRNVDAILTPTPEVRAAMEEDQCTTK